MIKAIVFDMDGVLIDARDWHYTALNRALDLFGLPISRYDHLVTYDGLPTKKKLKMLSAERGLPCELHNFINDLKQIYTAEIVHAKCKPVFQHQYALSRLKEQGYRIAVCSNSIRSSVELMMEKADLLQYLDVYFSNQDVERAKPAPDIYQKAIQVLEVEPHETVVLEDNMNGIAAAKAAQTNVLQVSSTTDVTYANIQSFIQQIEKKG
ncbi:MAG: HAD family hydrolase [Oligoflexales bacterium]